MAAKKSRRRAKTASGTKVEAKAEEKSSPAPRELNRLQKAISGKKNTERKVTITQAKRIKKAEKQLGILSALPDAPVEIFCEIASYFAPEDLLRLSQVSRELRGFLLSKNSQRLWTACLSKTDLPPCPDDLNEPQYVFLLYDKSCNGCNAPHVRTVYYELRIRLCKSCFEVNVFSKAQLYYKYSSETLNLLDLIPHCSRYSSNHKYYYEQDILAIEKEWNAIEGNEERKIFRNNRRQIVAKIHYNAYHFQRLEKAKASDRKEELRDLGEEFTESVKEKLKELGYMEKDWSRWYQNDAEGRARKEKWDKLILQKKVLTPRSWKILLPKLEGLIDSNKTAFETADRNNRVSQRTNEFRSRYCEYTHNLNLSCGEIELMPCASDLMKIPAIADSVKYDDSHRVFTGQLFALLLPKIAEALPDYRQRVLEDHDKAITQYRARGKERICSVDDALHVFLASSFFSTYRSTVYYFLNPGMPVVSGASYDPFHSRTSCQCYAWSENFVHINKAYVSLADTVLNNLGLSSATTMSAAVAMGECFVCGLCDEVFQEPLGWIELIEHFITKGRWEIDAQRRCLWKENENIKVLRIHLSEEKDTLRVSARKLEGEELLLAKERQKRNATKIKSCALCRALREDFLMTDEQVTVHIRTTHGKVAEPSDIINLSTGP